MITLISILSAAVGSLVVFVIYTCAVMHVPSITFSQFIRETFLPTSVREFLLPPCPMCWALRIAVAAFAIDGFIIHS